MLELLGYFMAAYLIVGLMLTTFARWMSRVRRSASPRRSQRFRIACLLLLLLPFCPYLQVALQTALVGSEVRPVVEQSLPAVGTEGAPISTLRVLTLTSQMVRVYVVQTQSPGPRSADNLGIGIVFGLERTPSGWKYRDCQRIWSDGGNAEGNTFPPYADGM